MAKKKGGVKSAAIAAKEAELAKEAEVLRQQQEKERLRNEEVALRQRVEEEERKVLEDLRIRETTVANAIAERARQQNFDAVEKELLETIAIKDRDIQELKAKVRGLEAAHDVLQSERESAMRRAALLDNELELAQLRHLECESRIENAEKLHQTSRRTLESQYDEVQKAMAILRAEHEHLNQKHSALQDSIANAPPPLSEQVGNDLNTLEPRTVDTETAVLLKVLHGEVEKYKEEALALQASLDARGRDEEKSSLLVSIMNTQLDAVREENRRLHTTAQSRLREVESIQAFLEEEKKKNKQLYEELDRLSSESAVQLRQLQLEVGVHKGQVEELTSRLSTLSHQHQLAESEHKDFVARATDREQEDFKANVAMKTELVKQQENLAKLLQEKKTLHDESFNYKVLTRAEMDSLKSRLQKFEVEMERRERESHETITVLRTDSEKHEVERKLLTESFNATQARLTEDLERCVKALNTIQREHEELKRHSTHTQKDLYEKLTHMTACHDSKHEEVMRLRQELEKKNVEYTNNAIFLNAENENLKAKVNALQQDAEERRQEHLEHIRAIEAELTGIQDHMQSDMEDHKKALGASDDRADRATRNVRALQDQVRAITLRESQSNEKHDLVVREMKADAKEMRTELNLAKRTIERLEGALGDQAGYKQLVELNEKLKEEKTEFQRTISHLNSTVASMKMECNVAYDDRLQRLAEEREKLQRRAMQLERLQKLAAPLLVELREVAERHGMTAAMHAALDRYDVNVKRCLSSGSSEEAAAGLDGESVAAPMLRPSPPSSKRTVMRDPVNLPPL